jgi:hypothetical protein
MALDPEALVNEVTQDVSAALMRQTAAIDAAGPTPEGAFRAAALIAVLRAYATVLEEQCIPVVERGNVETFTKHTTDRLRAALKAANKG